jgi:ferric-dicitrate binding protein FerR (iron transport regulator)
MANESDNTKHRAGEDESFASLIKLAGERPEIPLSVESRVYHRVQEEWRKSAVEPKADKVYKEVHKTWRRESLRGKILRWLLPAGVAATAIFAMLMVLPPEPPAVQVAGTISRVIGSGQLSSEHPEGSTVTVGEIIATESDEGVSLLLARSESLRIDENTQVRVDAVDQFTLISGRVYADTGQFVYRDGGLKINTDFGLVTDVGTQFSVATTDRVLDVAVREGRVDVRNESHSYAARMGQRLTVSQGQAPELIELEPHDVYWNWIVDLTPVFDMTNKSLLDFLRWAARETGRELQFESDESRMFAMRTDVHGSVDGLTPDEALQAILATTTVRYRIEDDRIVIEN